MIRAFAPVLSVFCLVLAATASAQVDAPVWYIQYEVKLRVDHTETGPGRGGVTTTTYKLERDFSSVAKLDMRNQGAVLSMDMSGFDAEKYKKMTPAEQLKVTETMMSSMQYTANWMAGPLDVGGEPDAMQKHMLAVSVPVRIDYVTTTTGSNLPDETGGKYDYYAQSTANANGGKVYVANDQAKFEMNSQSKKYWLVLPYGGQDMSSDRNDLKWVHVTKMRAAGTTTWGDEERKTEEGALDGVAAGLTFNALPNGSQLPVIEGTLPEGSGPITGEKSFTGKLQAGRVPEAPFTLTFKYTLTQTEPAKKAAGK